MSLAGYLFLILEIVLYGFLVNKFNRFRGGFYIAFTVFLFVWHMLFALLNWDYSLNNSADSTYYFELAKTDSVNWGVGTKFVVNILSIFDVISQYELTYLDSFIVFAVFGVIGHLLLVDALQSISVDYLKKYWWIHFIPGLHFWTVAVGKDGLAFLSVSLFVWSLVRFDQRIIYAAAAAILLFLLRPHMAMVLAFAAFGTVLLMSRLSASVRIALSLSVVIAIIYLIPQILAFVQLESLGQVEDYIKSRQNYNQIGGGAIPLHTYSLPVAVLTYLFRPLFFDAGGLTGFIVSLENIIYIWGFLYLMLKCNSSVLQKCLKNHISLFSILFVVVGTVLLASTTANMGIAIRQKTMILPFFIVLFVIVYRLGQRESGNK